MAPTVTARATRTRVAAVLGAIALLVAAYRLGVFETFDDPAQATATLVRLGPWGYLAFVGAFAALQPFGIPGTVFVMAAPLIWPWPVAFALSMTGTMLASLVGFSFARLVAREWVSKIIPERFRRYDDALARQGFRTVFLLRLVFWMPPLLHAFFGVSKVRFWTHFWGSFFGYLLPLFLMSFFGQALFDALRRAPAVAWFEVGGGLVAAAFAAWVVRRAMLSRRARVAGSPSAGA